MSEPTGKREGPEGLYEYLDRNKKVVFTPEMIERAMAVSTEKASQVGHLRKEIEKFKGLPPMAAFLPDQFRWEGRSSGKETFGLYYKNKAGGLTYVEIDPMQVAEFGKYSAVLEADSRSSGFGVGGEVTHQAWSLVENCLKGLGAKLEDLKPGLFWHEMIKFIKDPEGYVAQLNESPTNESPTTKELPT